METTVSYLTLAGARFNKRPRYDMRTRAIAASNHGISRMGISIREPYDEAVTQYVDVPEVEWIDLDRPVSPKTLDTLRRMRDIGATRVNVGVCNYDALDYERMAMRSELIANTGLTVAIEPVSFGSLNRVSDVLSLVRLIDRTDVGMLYDFWHVWQDDATFYVPPDHIAEVQVCGVPEHVKRSDRLAASQDRPAIEQSAVDVSGWLSELHRDGYTGPVSYECPHNFAGNETLSQRVYLAWEDMKLGELS